MSITLQATTTQTVKLAPQLRRKLLTELRAYAELKQQAAAIASAMEKHKSAVSKIREDLGETSIAIEGFKVTQVIPTRSTLDKKKLVELGCAAAWINEATVVAPGRPYTKLTTPGEKEEAD